MYPTYLRDYTKTGIEGSDAIWIAALGPGVTAGAKPGGAGCLSQSQVAASALTALGLDWTRFDPKAGAPLPGFAR
jgi:hypothetical protein